MSLLRFQAATPCEGCGSLGFVVGSDARAHRGCCKEHGEDFVSLAILPSDEEDAAGLFADGGFEDEEITVDLGRPETSAELYREKYDKETP